MKKTDDNLMEFLDYLENFNKKECYEQGRDDALREVAELVLKTSTLPTFEWLANKIRNLP
jgi:hypothetical protein